MRRVCGIVEFLERQTMKRVLMATMGVIGIAGLAAVAFAQVPPHMHGGHDPVGVIQALHDQLGLNTSQQQQWDSAVAQTQAARDAARTAWGQLKTATQAELAKAEPDLAALAAQADAIQAQTASTRKAARDSWLALYATFTPQQKGIVRDAINARIARMAQFRAKMQQRFQQQPPASQ
jgi:hypothetical protein